MHEYDLNRVVFYSKEDGATGQNLTKGEHILKGSTKSDYTDINDVFELYNLKKYIDNEVYLKTWQDDITNFKRKATEYGKIIGQFISNINDQNVIDLYERTLRGYVNSFWELINNQNAFKRISKANFTTILLNEPHVIHVILTHKNLVDYYDSEIKNFLLTYSTSAEILLSIYEVKHDFRKDQKFLPKSLTVEDKENIISNYLDSSDVNYNYIGLIQNARKDILVQLLPPSVVTCIKPSSVPA